MARAFENEPMLLYILAQAQKEQGEAAKAEETAHRAFGINAGREEMSLLNRYIPLNLMNLYRDAVMGREEMKLLNRYLIAERLDPARDCSIGRSANWNTSSPRAAPRTSPRSTSNGAFRKCSTIRATTWRPPMSWTACSKTVDAKTYVALPARIASVLQRFYLFRKKSPPDKIIERTIAEVRARKYYLEACHWEAAGDQAKRRNAWQAPWTLIPATSTCL